MNKTYKCAHCYKGMCMKTKAPCKNNMDGCNRVSTAREIALNYINYHFRKDADFYTNCIDYPLGRGFTLSLGDYNGKIRIMLYDFDEPVDLCWGSRINLGSIYTDVENLQDNIADILNEKKELLRYGRM